MTYYATQQQVAARISRTMIDRMPALENKISQNCCKLQFYAYLCNATVNIYVPQASGHRDNREHRQFYYNPLYISLIYVGCCKLGLYRAAFLFNSSNCNSQMKQVRQAAGTSLPSSVKAGTIFSWANVAQLLNALPMGICECKTVEDAKGYVKVFSLIISAFILAAIEKGGSL